MAHRTCINTSVQKQSESFPSRCSVCHHFAGFEPYNSTLGVIRLLRRAVKEKFVHLWEGASVCIKKDKQQITHQPCRDVKRLQLLELEQANVSLCFPSHVQARLKTALTIILQRARQLCTHRLFLSAVVIITNEYYCGYFLILQLVGWFVSNSDGSGWDDVNKSDLAWMLRWSRPTLLSASQPSEKTHSAANVKWSWA